MSTNASGSPVLSLLIPIYNVQRYLRECLDSALAQTLKDGFTPGFDVLGGPMGEVIKDSTSFWTDEDLNAVAVYLLAE